MIVAQAADVIQSHAVEDPVKAVDVVRAVDVIQSKAFDVISGSHAVIVDVIQAVVVDDGAVLNR